MNFFGLSRVRPKSRSTWSFRLSLGGDVRAVVPTLPFQHFADNITGLWRCIGGLGGKYKWISADWATRAPAPLIIALGYAQKFVGRSDGQFIANLEASVMRVTATEAKIRFSSLSAEAKREPVFVEKAGQHDTVIISAEHHQMMPANHDKVSRAARKKNFEAEFGDYIAAENVRVEARGIPGADLRPW